MKNQNKQTMTDRMVDFFIKILVKCIPIKSEFKTQRTKAIFKTFLLVLCIMLCVSFAVILFGIYLLGLFLMVFGKILSFGASADKKYQKSQDRHYDEHGRYY